MTEYTAATPDAPIESAVRAFMAAGCNLSAALKNTGEIVYDARRASASLAREHMRQALASDDPDYASWCEAIDLALALAASQEDR